MLIRAAAVPVPESADGPQQSPAPPRPPPPPRALGAATPLGSFLSSCWLPSPIHTHMAAFVDSLLFVVFLVDFLHPTYAGCYQRRLCCAGRNVTCSAIEDGIAHLPTYAPPDAQQSRVGELKLPEWFDFEGSGIENPDEFLPFTEPPRVTKRDTGSWIDEQEMNTSPAVRVQHLLLGLPYFANNMLKDRIRYFAGQPILRRVSVQFCRTILQYEHG